MMLRLAGIAALALLLALTLGPLLALLAWPGTPARPPGLGSALRFTLVQAGLSALLSLVLALPLARALARRRFPGRQAVLALLALPFFLPPLVAATGILALSGRSGLAGLLGSWLGFDAPPAFGLHGILLAHVFLNLPLATWLILAGLASVPHNRHRLAQTLNMRGMTRLRVLEAPVLAAVLPGAFLLIFLFCAGSFGIVLMLGGGPAAASLEVLIYQALRFDLDPGAAARLALVQCLICLAAALPLWLRPPLPRQGVPGRPIPPQRPEGKALALDGAVILLALVFLTLPLAAVALRGLQGDLPQGFAAAAFRSLAVALGASALASLLAVTLALAWEERGRLALTLAFLPQALSPLVIGTGLYVLIAPHADPFALALVLTALVNGCFAVPLILAALLPALARVRAEHGHLVASLNLRGWALFVQVTWPALRAPLRLGAALTAALSVGDFGVIALFAPPEGGTLPLLMQRQLGAYRMQDAAAVALAMLLLAAGLFLVIGGRGLRGHQV